jgi:hypothetical protein
VRSTIDSMDYPQRLRGRLPGFLASAQVREV